MMFNNKTNSLGTSSIMSNKLHSMLSPVEQRQFNFNQQVANKLNQDASKITNDNLPYNSGMHNETLVDEQH